MLNMPHETTRKPVAAILVGMIILTGVCIFDLFFPGRRIASLIILLILWGPRVAFLLISQKKSCLGPTKKKPDN
jgi:hypothetical protein